MVWAVVIETGMVEVRPGSVLERRIQCVPALLPGWRIPALRWCFDAHGRSYIAYIERDEPECFIAPSSMRTPAAAIREAMRRAREHNPLNALSEKDDTQ